MLRLGFVFPGQGAQYPGMGKELAQNYTEAALVFEQADDILGYSLSKLCFDGPADKLNQTEYAQPALLTTSTAILKVVEKQGWQASMMAGLSLGEYSALVAAQAITLDEALPLVQARAHLMQEAVPAGQGSMAAVLGLDHNMVENACRNAAGLIDVANYNCPGQVVISGEAQVVAEVGSELKKAGGRVIPLKVSVPSHSRLMSPAAEGLKPLLDKIPWKEPGVPVLSNVNAASNTAAQLPDILAAQLISSVRWEQSMIHMLEQVDNIIEIGPGSTLSGLIKKINKERLLGHIEDLDSLNNIEKRMNQIWNR
ncbi:MAG TPA: [acyl-carrier-protein] S-malonyltransferase [Syntrophomonas sp.]|jgi:[acyl-carrier-protein] S-malonyltransferase|nr:[acyl-carrier-protein] S-malonyltransferase [Syntrophomonas sp.]HCF71567.1 [acyl-carrier-protein] S-malonyltransferase [Syntrophomonas sp.]